MSFFSELKRRNGPELQALISRMIELINIARDTLSRGPQT